MREREREKRKQGQRAGADGKADFLLSREPDVGLNFMTLDHDFRQRQLLNPLSHSGTPSKDFCILK